LSDLVTLSLPSPVYLVAVLLILSGYAYGFKHPLPLSRARHVLAFLTIWAWIFTTPGGANLLVARMEGNPNARPTIDSMRAGNGLIVVLASGEMHSRNGTPNARLDAHGWERIHAGLTLWRQVGGKLLLAGGPGEAPDRSLAALMRKIAIDAGVPADSIEIQPKSNTTYEDLLYSRDRILAQHGPVWLVTSALHMPRSLGVAEKLGLSVTPWPCDYRQIEKPTWRIWFPDNSGPQTWGDVLHEILGIHYYRLQGWSA
jgi:uncharacterized SAM-binding protein YcdF (DUF218 family)